MFDYFKQQTEDNFVRVKVLKETDKKSVIRIKHKESGREFVLRKQAGNADIYRKLMEVKSRYLPEIFEVAESDGEMLVLEEFINGDSLQEMLEGSCFSEKETRSICLDICKALYILHSRGIVHRDVKPDNIILRGREAVLLDLDASRQMSGNDKGTDTVALGTTGFAAPEQYGISATDGRADIYALGVTMNIMLTGEHPSVRLASGRLKRVIERCIMVHPGKRYKDVGHLMEALS